MEKKSLSFTQSALVLTGVNLFSQILGFAFRVWLSRMVTPVALGLYQLIMPVYSVMMSLCVSGLTVAVSRLTATHLATGNHRAARQTVRLCLMGYIGMVMALSLLVLPLSDAVSAHLLGDARTQLGLILLLPCMALTGWENVHKNYFYGSKNVIPPAISEIVEQTTRTAAILGLLFWLKPFYEEQQVGLIVTGMILSEICSAGLLTLFYRRKQALLPDTGERNPKPWAGILTIAVPVAASNVVSNLIGSVNSIIVPGRLIASGMEPEASMGAYGVAFGMTMPLLGLPMAFMVAVSLTILPRLSESAALGDWIGIGKKIRQAVVAATAVVIPMAAVLIPFGTSIARALFKNPDAGQFMVPLVIATVFGCYEYVFGSMLNGLGRQRQTAAIYISTGLAQVALTYALVMQPQLRLMGYVIAYGVTTAAGAVAGMMCLWGLVRSQRLSKEI